MIDFPASPTVGQIFTAAGYSWRWDGVKWVVIGAGGPVITISDTAPSNPVVGALWYDSVGAQLYIYYNDGNSSQWVVAVNPSPGGGGASGTGFLPIAGGTITGNLTVQGKTTLAGVTDGSTAAAGQVGEYMSNNLSTPSWGTAGAWATACSLALSAGAWDINGAIQIAGNITGIQMGIATATTPTPPAQPFLSLSGSVYPNLGIGCPPLRISVAAAQTVYLLAALAATVSNSVNGYLWARRMR